MLATLKNAVRIDAYFHRIEMHRNAKNSLLGGNI